jgi:hypothetical protein
MKGSTLLLPLTVVLTIVSGTFAFAPTVSKTSPSSRNVRSYHQQSSRLNSAAASNNHDHNHIDEHHEVLIIGGGTGGLFAAKELISEKGIDDVVVLESRGAIGGRVKTTRDEDDNPMFNDFAWRIGETNTMMMDLCQQLNVGLVEQTTPSAQAESEQQSEGEKEKAADSKRKINVKNRPPLSDFAAAGLESADDADRQDRASGYAGRTSQVRFIYYRILCLYISGDISSSLPLFIFSIVYFPRFLGLMKAMAPDTGMWKVEW